MKNSKDFLRYKADVQQLILRASEGDITSAREALILMAKRGFHRGKDLPAELAKALEQYRPK